MKKIINNIKKEVLELIEDYKNSADDHYDFWNEHIKYVYDEAIKLAKIYNADITVVKLGALLHDIALIKKVGDRKEHHSNGAIIGKEILEKYNCPIDITNKVVGCIYNHRSSKKAQNIEEICVCDADILAHFDNIPMLFNSAFNRNNLNLNEAKLWIKNCFKKDYDELSDKTKKMFKNRYNNILNVVLGELKK